MDESTRSRPVDQLAGDGWLFSGASSLGAVTYAIDVFQLPAPDGPGVSDDIELKVRLLHHAIDADTWKGQFLVLQLHDGRRIAGVLAEDGASLHCSGTGALA